MAEGRTDKEIKKMELDVSQVTRTKSILNTNQIQKLWNSTRAIYKYERPAKGGGNWTYVKGSYVRKVLDSVFGFDWSFNVETTVGEAFEVAKLTGTVTVKGILTGRVVDDRGVEREITKVQFGRSDVKWVKGRSPDDVLGKNLISKPLDFGNDMKAAATDAFKKCASLFGIAQDVYEAEEFLEIIITGSEEDKGSKTAGRVSKKLKKEEEKERKKTIKKEGEKVDK